MNTTQFIKHIKQEGVKHYRDMPWRSNLDPYFVYVSEMMLQQTQVGRVMPKFEAFVAELPTIGSLAKADSVAVLRLWSGLGYNRRARFLHQAAKTIASDFNGTVPRNEKDLMSLPGIGVNTAAAIRAYAYNQPVVFVETNIRSVYLHHFFPGKEGVDDKELLPLIEETLDYSNPRTWYWALMDYGTHVKQAHGNTARASKSHTKQSRFEGSLRQVRGRVIARLVAANGRISYNALSKDIADKRLDTVLAQLKKEGFLEQGAGEVVISF